VLRHLDLRGCEQLSSLPESIGQLSALRHLDISGCSQLSSLPESIGQLSALQSLDLSWLSQLSSLPESIGQLSTLQHLDLSGCSRLSSLPESICQLSALQSLDVHGSALAYFGQAQGEGSFRRLCHTVAPAGCWIQEWRIRSGSAGITSVQGVLQDGRALAAMAVSSGGGRGGGVVVAPEEGSSCFTQVTGRCGGPPVEDTLLDDIAAIGLTVMHSPPTTKKAEWGARVSADLEFFP
jgi:hypothetical protein